MPTRAARRPACACLASGTGATCVCACISTHAASFAPSALRSEQLRECPRAHAGRAEYCIGARQHVRTHALAGGSPSCIRVPCAQHCGATCVDACMPAPAASLAPPALRSEQTCVCLGAHTEHEENCSALGHTGHPTHPRQGVVLRTSAKPGRGVKATVRAGPSGPCHGLVWTLRGRVTGQHGTLPRLGG